jgi:hypothetical protein
MIISTSIHRCCYLEDWGTVQGNSLLSYPKQLKHNIWTLDNLRPDHLVGIGKSGAAILGAYQVLKSNPMSTVTVYEPGVMRELPEGNAMFVDDHIYTGRTLKLLREYMHGKDYLKVTGIFAQRCNEFEKLIVELFPNVKLLVY